MSVPDPWEGLMDKVSFLFFFIFLCGGWGWSFVDCPTEGTLNVSSPTCQEMWIRPIQSDQTGKWLSTGEIQVCWTRWSAEKIIAHPLREGGDGVGEQSDGVFAGKCGRGAAMVKNLPDQMTTHLQLSLEITEL